MRSPLLRPSAALVAAVLLDSVAVYLTVIAFRNIGSPLLTGRNPDWVRVGAPLVGSYVVETVAAAVASVAGLAFAMHIRRRTLDYALNVDPDVARLNGLGTAHAIALDSDLVGSLLVASGPAVLLAVVELFGGVLVLAKSATRPIFPLISVAACVVVIAVAAHVARLHARWSAKRASITSLLLERLIGHRTVSVQESDEEARGRGDRTHLSYMATARSFDSWMTTLVGSAAISGAGLVLFVASQGTQARTLATALGGALLVSLALLHLAEGLMDLSSAGDALRRVLLLHRWRLAPVPKKRSPGALLSAQNLTYTYDGQSGLSEPISLELNEGDRVLLTGDSGSGKSTLAQLLAGRRVPETGEVVTHSDARIIRVPAPGDDHIFHGSLLLNLLCGSQWPPTEEAARRAYELLPELGLDELVARMPNGLAQPVGDGGWRLSSGEAARIGLARALLAQPDVLLLDEVTSPLDPITRQRVLDTASRRARSLVVISHD